MMRNLGSFWQKLLYLCLLSSGLTAQTSLSEDWLRALAREVYPDHAAVFQRFEKETQALDSTALHQHLKYFADKIPQNPFWTNRVQAYFLIIHLSKKYKFTALAEEALHLAHQEASQAQHLYWKARCFQQQIDWYKTYYQYDQALNKCFEAIHLLHNSPYQALLAQLHYEAGGLLYDSQNYQQAKKHFLQVCSIPIDSLPSRVYINTFNSIGMTFRHQGKTSSSLAQDSALYFFRQALQIALQKNDSTWIGILSGNMGSVFLSQGNYPEAITALKTDLYLSMKASEWQSASNAAVMLSETYMAMRDFKKAKIYLDSAWALQQRKLPAHFNVPKRYAEYYAKIGDYAAAYRWTRQWMQLEDSIRTFQQKLALANIQTAFGVAKQQLEIESLQQEQALNKAQIERWYFLSIGSIAIIGLLSALLSILYNNYQYKKRTYILLQEKQQEILAQNEALHQQQAKILNQQEAIEQSNQQLQEQHQQIRHSIQAAKAIQQAILPETHKASLLLGDFFVINRPKDVVSGDFYWLHKLGDTTLLAVADCTGHGIPGAFMTLIGHTLLDKIVQMGRIANPAEVLDCMHYEIQALLKQPESRNNSGMDIAVVAIQPIDNTRVQLQFSGAKLSLHTLNKRNGELITFRGTRKSVGGEAK